MKGAECGESPSAEALTMECVQQQTTISIPAIRRSVRDRSPGNADFDEVDGWGFIAMDYIPGSTLRVAWPTLSLWGKLEVVWTLRQYIHQLRRVASPYSNRPGPIGGPSALRPLGILFNDRGPSFETVDDMVQYYEERKSRGFLPPDSLPFPDASPLVMTHGDLHMSNIILDRSGRVWLIDWGASGYFPAWFEYITAVRLATATNGATPTSWLVLLPLIAGPYFAHEAFAEHAGILLRMQYHTSFTGLYAIWVDLKSRVGRLYM